MSGKQGELKLGGTGADPKKVIAEVATTAANPHLHHVSAPPSGLTPIEKAAYLEEKKAAQK